MIKKIIKGYEFIFCEKSWQQFNRHKYFIKPNGKGVYLIRGERISTNKRVTRYFHRELLGLKAGDGLHADHINRNTLDNRIENLRAVAPHQNNLNKSKQRGAASRYFGVSPALGSSKTNYNWRADIRINKKVFCIGFFKTEEEAARARDEWAKKIYPGIAPLNFL